MKTFISSVTKEGLDSEDVMKQEVQEDERDDVVNLKALHQSTYKRNQLALHKETDINFWSYYMQKPIYFQNCQSHSVDKAILFKNLIN